MIPLFAEKLIYQFIVEVGSRLSLCISLLRAWGIDRRADVKKGYSTARLLVNNSGVALSCSANSGRITYYAGALLWSKNCDMPKVLNYLEIMPI